MTICRKETPSKSESPDKCDEESYCIDVMEIQTDLMTLTLESFLDSTRSNLFLFNREVETQEVPKVIFATDCSDQATENLNNFKLAKPAGFGGATVISEPESTNIGTSLDETSRTFLERIRSAAHASQANLIIANFDLGNLGRKSIRMSNLVKLVLQNKCHVLILKS